MFRKRQKTATKGMLWIIGSALNIQIETIGSNHTVIPHMHKTYEITLQPPKMNRYHHQEQVKTTK